MMVEITFGSHEAMSQGLPRATRSWVSKEEPPCGPLERHSPSHTYKKKKKICFCLGLLWVWVACWKVPPTLKLSAPSLETPSQT